MTASRAPLDVCVVAHTHWDREWYHPAARFRQRLVALIDALLAPPGEGHPAPAPFLLDGQAITLLDYLAVRPERDVTLRDRLQGGALEAGPWFVLADNLIPSGEAILRNLEAGRRVLYRFGAVSPKVAYCPDTFGHPAALPSIAAGYGFGVAIVWRGMGGATHPVSDAVRWTGADGASVLAYHLPPDGYEVGSALPAHPDAARERWTRLAAMYAARNRTGVVLLPNGADHHALQPDVESAVNALRDAAAPAARVQRTTLADFADRLTRAAAHTALPEVRGELRDSYGYTWTLGGTLGTRAHQKRRNAQLERLLLRDVEPWLAVAWLRAAEARARHVSPEARLTLAQLPALLNAAWQELLATHPHDTLCGCSIDAVARAMDARQESVRAQALGLREAALDLVLQHDVVAARARPVGHGLLVVRNRTAAARGGVAECRLVETLGDVPVGPGSAAAAAVPMGDPAHHAASWAAQHGVTLQLRRTRVAPLRRESPQHYPDNDLVREHDVLVWVPPVPAFGVRCIGGRRTPRADAAPPVALPPLTVRDDDGTIVLENDTLRVTVHDGRVCLEQGGRRIDDALALVTTTDVGDSYTPSLRGAGESLRCVATQLRHHGPLRVAVRLRWETAARDVRVDTTLVLDAGAASLRCDVHGDNRKRDHRLQLIWRTGLADAVTTADAAFGPVIRAVAAAPADVSATPRETVVPTMPLHRWVAQTAGAHSTVLLTDGLAEAESTPGALAVTLLRAVGALSRADLPERPGHAGWPSATPEAQCRGPFRARLGVFLLDVGGDTLGDAQDNAHAAAAWTHTVGATADALLLPLAGHTVRDLDHHTLSERIAGVTLTGIGLEASAITLAQQHDGVILRAVNLTAHPTRGTWHLPHEGPWQITRCRLDETPLGDPVASGARVAFQAGPREIVTMLITTA